MTAEEESAVVSPARPPRISGTAVVLGMLLLGSVATTVMYVYWDLHTKPFRPLTEAIGRTFKNSLPKVEGGRHKKGPNTLRVALRVPFTPETDAAKTEETLAVVQDLIRRHQDLAGYDEVQIHLFQMVPEAKLKSKRFVYQPDEIQSLPARGETKFP